MAIPEGYKANFDTLLRAASNGEIALMECERIDGDSEKVMVICASVFDPVANEFIFTPLAKMFDGNPYEEVRPVDGEEEEEG